MNTVQLQQHTPVMLQEVLDELKIKPNGTYLDCTFGRGGHSKAILECLNQQGRLLVTDVDPEAIYHANQLQAIDSRVTIFQGSFAKAKYFCNLNNIKSLDGVLLDLGVSSPQLDNPERGFSFSKDGLLDMRMDPLHGEPAYKWLKSVSLENLTIVLQEYGEERFALPIAKAIIRNRDIKPILTTFDLVAIINKYYPKYQFYKFKHPATRTFQAIRIFINQELLNLQYALPELLNLLEIYGKLVVISFHSLEDKIVKNFIKQYSEDNLKNNYAIRKLPIIKNNNTSDIKLINTKKLKAKLVEINNNNRARSAIMRVAEKCA